MEILLTLAAMHITFSALSVILGIVGFSAAALSVRPYLKGTAMKAELDAKDRVIETYQQTVDSFTGRMDGLKLEIGDINDKLKNAETKITILQTELRHEREMNEQLKQYTAPEMLKEVQTNTILLQEIARNVLSSPTPQHG